MPYIGNEPSADFTSLTKQDLTGSSGGSVTLSHAVANAEDVALYINNVRQEPTTSYTTDGTILSFVGYTVSASDDIYVLFLGKAIQTTVPPDGSVGTAKLADDAVNLTSKVTGVLPVANGGTGATSLPIVHQITEQATTSGTTKDFTVPTTAKQIFFSLEDFTFGGSTNMSIGFQLGDSGGIETSGYVDTVAYVGGGHASDGNHATNTSMGLIYLMSSPSDAVSGFVHLINTTGNKWFYHAQIRNNDYVSNSAGYKSLSSTITTVRITTTGGATLTGGACAVAYIGA